MKTRRPNAVTRFLMALFVIMLIPQGTWAADKVIYYKYDGTKFVEADADTYTLNPSSTTWSGGTIVITGTMNYDDRIEVTGDVDLVLCDQATLNAKRGIGVPVGATLTIYGQEKGTGELNARGYYYNVAQSANSFLYYGGAAIGGCHHGFNGSTAGTSYECGSVIIHGGIITADSSTSGTANDAAGIGGFGSAGPSELTVYGGKVTAKGGKYSAGIGGGGQSKGGGTVSIYGGEVIATGGAGDGADGTYGVAMGIGAGSLLNGPRAAAPSNGTLTLYPGATCYGGNNTTTADLTTGPVTVTTRDQYMKTVKSYDLWVSGIQVTEDNRTNIWSGTDISFNPVNSTLHYKDGGSTAYSVHSGLPSLTIRIGSPDGSTPPDYSKNNISIIKFGSPNKEAIAATGGTLTLSKEDNVAGVQQFDIVAYGSEPSLIQGFDDVTYSDFVIMQDGAVYNTTTKQLEYPNPNGSGYVGLDATTTFRTPQDISGFYVADIPNQDYTGSPLNANIIVKETETATPALVENTDYTVSYQLAGAAATPQDAKTYDVIITGIGLYTGSITAKTFTIDPASATIHDYSCQSDGDL